MRRGIKARTIIMQTEKKTAIVTGGGSGLGFAIAKAFTQNGITTIIAGRDQAKLKKAQEQLGPLCFFKVLDVTDYKAVPAFIEEIESTYGPIDILVNNAGINQKKEFTEVSDIEFTNMLNTNVTAVFVLSREVVKKMLTRKKGSILNISSMAAQYGLPKVIAYTASKTAIEGMTRAMAVELSPMGIRVNAIAPGFIYSDMTAKALDSDPERKARVMARTPMGQMGQPEDIGAAALYLSGEDARYITGVVLPVDGGNSISY
ncbi:SDR family NAD(P)-dependent oxidoreductase [Flavihumibacter cheonanensis]|jgi:NAD(P)-dependent dehydrogenase (short-subunit alcohol dehydrogenase family)|uniref:SDR family NAD(P)-dependent oxidoreductase n=1 Tax=Flavihumibacter cheonanensis TaxID=1442385 RepID=UPI001EF85E10|nr:SDR family oxidoreductase [Flavihumibacter cheonanensis]MCG7752300.1 SDR family oxidoreductase [Flavihumibacter cheonanensis]